MIFYQCFNQPWIIIQVECFRLFAVDSHLLVLIAEYQYWSQLEQTIQIDCSWVDWGQKIQNLLEAARC